MKGTGTGRIDMSDFDWLDGEDPFAWLGQKPPTLRVVPVSKEVCEAFVTQKHYSRRASIFWAGFGLVEAGHIVGVAVYGQPSPPIQRNAFKDRIPSFNELIT